MAFDKLIWGLAEMDKEYQRHFQDKDKGNILRRQKVCIVEDSL